MILYLNINKFNAKFWFKNPKNNLLGLTGSFLHRKNGPAVEYADGEKRWYLNGKCHREDGPAVEYAYGSKEWWLKGICYIEKDYIKELNKHKLQTIFT